MFDVGTSPLFYINIPPVKRFLTTPFLKIGERLSWVPLENSEELLLFVPLENFGELFLFVFLENFGKLYLFVLKNTKNLMKNPFV